MSALQITEDIFSLSELKTRTSKVLRQLRDNGRPMIITQNGKPAAVLITPEIFDKVSRHIHFILHVEEGLADIEAGRVYDDDELDEEFGDPEEE